MLICSLCLYFGAVGRTIVYTFTELAPSQTSIGGGNCGNSFAMHNSLCLYCHANWHGKEVVVNMQHSGLMLKLFYYILIRDVLLSFRREPLYLHCLKLHMEVAFSCAIGAIFYFCMDIEFLFSFLSGIHSLDINEL